MESIEFKCKYCGRVFDSKRSCGVHQRYCKNNPDGEYNKQKSGKSISKAKTQKRLVFIKTCPKCGKQFEVIGTQSQFDRGVLKTYCSRACANSHVQSKETKQKIKKSVTETAKKQAENHTRYTKTKHFCKICGKEIGPTKTGLCSYCLHNTEEGKKLLSKAGLKSYEISIKRGHFQGWTTRNIDSYAEKFWMEVLDNNHIIYKREKRIGKYFLDFFIKKDDYLIDLEIDGKQHQYEDRAQSDKLRDEFLKKNNFIVYRVPWNEINSEEGKLLMKSKIDNFLEFLSNK